MADVEQRSGIVYYFRVENEAAAKKFAAQVESNNALLSKQEQAFRDAAKTADKSMKQTSDAVEKSAQKVDKSSRKFIKSISGIYAGFVLLPKAAQEAGEAIEAAAADEDIRKSYEELAEQAGTSAEQLLESMTRASKGTVTQIELMRIANRAFLAGGAEFATEIPRLFAIARATAAATGQDVLFVLDSLTKGIAKASIKLIDNAEIYIKVGQAVEEYAAASGRTADELDEVERRQAILNAVLEEGRDIIAEVGGDVDLATDAYSRYNSELIDAKRGTIDFFRDALGDENLARFKQFADILTTASPAIQSLALLSLAGLPVGKLAAITAILGGTVLAIDEVLPKLQDVEESLRDVDEEAGFLERRGSVFPDSIGDALGEIAGSFEFVYRMAKSAVDGSEEAREEFSRWALAEEGVGITEDFADALTSGAMAAGVMAAASELAADREEKLALAMKKASEAIERREALLEKLVEAGQKYGELEDERRKILEKINQRIEDEMERHVGRMSEYAREAAQDRADAYTDYYSEIADAERKLQRGLEDANRDHRFRLEDIERRYQRRMLEIRERYGSTVAKAARRRDVLAIINAREQRQIEERSATRDRDDDLHNENRHYQEQLRQVQEAYRDRIEEAKRGLAEELREIDLALQRQREKQEEAHQKKMKDLDNQYQEELDKLENQLLVIRSTIITWRNQLQNVLNANPITIPVRPGYGVAPSDRGGNITGDTGFSGVVEGPTNFKVGPGITEYIYASGPIGGSGQSGAREMSPPSSAATSQMALQHSIRGGLSVGMNGLTGQMLNNLGPALQDSIGQALVDAMTAGILASLN